MQLRERAGIILRNTSALLDPPWSANRRSFPLHAGQQVLVLEKPPVTQTGPYEPYWEPGYCYVKWQEMHASTGGGGYGPGGACLLSPADVRVVPQWHTWRTEPLLVQRVYEHRWNSEWSDWTFVWESARIEHVYLDNSTLEAKPVHLLTPDHLPLVPPLELVPIQLTEWTDAIGYARAHPIRIANLNDLPPDIRERVDPGFRPQRYRNLWG